MFKAIWAARWYVLLGLFVFTIALAVTTPLHFIWRFAEPQAANLPVNIKQISGTVWDGQVRVQDPQLGLLDVHWQLSPWKLLTANADLNLDVSGNGVQLKGQVMMGTDRQLHVMNTTGFLSSKHLQPLLRQGRASLQGDFEVTGLTAQLDIESRQINQLDGQLIFSGGDVGFPVDGKPVQAELPLLFGLLKRESDKSVLNIETQEGLPIGQAFIQNDGWGGVAIRRRFLDILGQKWPAEATEETVIFEVSRKIL